jgi:leucyl aminopeptidase (aminopeptidase T)
MEYGELTGFLQKEKLLDLVKENSFYFQNIFKNCLKAKKGKVLIISDLGKSKARTSVIMAACYYYAAMRLKLNPELIIQKIKTKTDESDKNVIDALSSLQKPSVIVLATSGYLGSIKKITKTFRGFCKENKHRFVSTSGLSELPTTKFGQLIKSIDVDYKSLIKKGKKIKKQLDKAKTLKIQTLKGTNLVVNIKGVKAVVNTGDYRKPGTGGNIPCGEVYLPPEEGKAQGKVFVDASIRHKTGTTLLKTPVILDVRDGIVTNITGAQAKRLVETVEEAEKKSKYPKNVRKLAEIGIGINPKAEIIGPNMVNEKTLGTAHVALGSNAWFGGKIYSIVHLDQVFKKPKIIIDNKLLKI